MVNERDLELFGEFFNIEYGQIVNIEELSRFLGHNVWHKFIATCRLDWTDDGLRMYVGPLVVTTVNWKESPMNPTHADIAEDAGLNPDECFGGILRIDRETGDIKIDDFTTASSVGVRLGYRFNMACKLALVASEELGATVISPKS